MDLIVVGVWVSIMFGALRPTVNYLCENETRPARLKVRGEMFIFGNLQALEMSREIVVHVEGASTAPGTIPFYGPVYHN